ncbi:MAG: class I SAM-dependent RNA methyltransferase [Planctomycetes bacterium]|nr:class I SAM-dependent RNA methyltransferase [Planctomycetota bacterium]
MPRPFDLFAACLPGLEPLLAGELSALGLDPRPLRGGVAFTGDTTQVLRAGLWLGTASHVLVRLAEFPCRALGELQRKASLLPWPEWLRPATPLAVRATARSSRVYHTGAIVERVENAIAGALGQPPPRDAADAPAALVHVRFQGDVCTLSLDATATPLHRRGYRLDGAKAPLREDLAHALVRASGFTGDEALLDPFCGAGTIAIEAAGLALGLPPGRLRPPPLEHLAPFDPAAWESVRSEARRPAAGAAPPIAAGDRDAGAIAAARENAARAGVAAAITFHHGAFTTQPWFAAGGAPARGVLVTNPPFGVRIPRAEGLLALHQTLGHRARTLGPGWRFALLAHDVRLARRTGLPLRAAFTTRHGGLSVSALVGSIPAADLGGPPDDDGPGPGP